jgi:ankyrin repeat protein
MLSDAEIKVIRSDIYNGDTSSAKDALERDPLLLNNHFIPHISSIYTLLICTCDSSHELLEFVKFLVESGAKVNEKPKEMIDPRKFDIPSTDIFACALLNAVYNRHFNIIEYLLQHGANANTCTRTRGTCRYAIEIASGKGCLNICLVLISHGARLNMKDGSPVICENYGNECYPPLSEEQKKEDIATILAAIQRLP